LVSQLVDAIDVQAISLIGKVFDEIKYETIIKRYIYCGYFHSHAMGLD
jgi:hypothetical protein